MPNHTANNFTVTGPTADVERFIKQAQGSTAIDFNSLLPMPEELRGTSSPVRIQTQAEIDTLWAEYNRQKQAGTLHEFELKENKPFGLGITQEQYGALLAKYGTADWYNWAVNNWGTKWGAYDVTKWSVNGIDSETSAATIYYETAWTPATALWLTVSKMYPTLTFFHEFADEGGGFLGNETIENGDIVDEQEFEWNSDEGVTLREGLGRYYPEDEAGEE